MMVVAHKALSIELAQLTKWTTLYWWNLERPKTAGPNGKSGKPRWVLDSKKTSVKSIPAYNFDFLFERLRAVFLTQADKEQLEAFKIMLTAPNPADSLAKLAITLAQNGLLK